MDDLAKDLLFNAVYHHSLPFEIIPKELIEEYQIWVKIYKKNQLD